MTVSTPSVSSSLHTSANLWYKAKRESRSEAYKKTMSKNYFFYGEFGMLSQPVITCSKLAIETLEEGVKYVQS